MHFFAKIFLCGTIVLSMTFLFSGYYFMNYSFEENLEKEKNLVISQYQYDKFTIQTVYFLMRICMKNYYKKTAKSRYKDC